MLDAYDAARHVSHSHRGQEKEQSQASNVDGILLRYATKSIENRDKETENALFRPTRRAQRDATRSMPTRAHPDITTARPPGQRHKLLQYMYTWHRRVLRWRYHFSSQMFSEPRGSATQIYRIFFTW